MKTLLIAAGAVALMTGAAFAQSPTDSGTTNPVAPNAAGDPTLQNADGSPLGSQGTSAATPNNVAPADSAVGTTMGTTTMAANVQTVTNGPIPDTPENRAKYGAPLSRAGKRTAPVGN